MKVFVRTKAPGFWLSLAQLAAHSKVKRWVLVVTMILTAASLGSRCLSKVCGVAAAKGVERWSGAPIPRT